MPANKYALLRYRIIDRCLTNPGKPFPTKEDLRQACEDALYGSDMPNASIAEAIVLAVYIPPQAPAPGHDRCTICLRCRSSIEPARYCP